MNDALLLVFASPSLVVVGVPDCWVDARRLAQSLRRAAANDNDRGDVVMRSSVDIPPGKVLGSMTGAELGDS